MKPKHSLLAMISTLSLCSVSFAQEQTPPANPPHDHGAMTAGSTTQSKGSQDLHKAMMDGMQEMHSMKMTGNTDVDFASMMIEHHEQAIAMSKAQLQSGKDPEVKRKANEIIAASEKDIAELKKWKSQQGSASR